MSKTRVASSGVVALATLLAAAFVPAHSAAQSNPTGMPSALNVKVTNTPLPVQGTVSVATNTPLPVQGEVSVAGVVSIKDVDKPTLQPFQHSGVFGIAEGTLGANHTFEVPNGKRLVIEFVSFDVNFATGQRPTLNFVSVENSTANASPISFHVPLIYQATLVLAAQNSDLYIGNSMTRLYADPGSTVTLGVRKTGSTGTGLASVSVSGHLVDVP